MEKTAKQIFEELGWKYRRYYSNNEDTKIIECEGEGVLNGSKVYIRFFLEDKSGFNIETKMSWGHLTTEITLPLLKAINKQVEELGWGKEGENE